MHVPPISMVFDPLEPGEDSVAFDLFRFIKHFLVLVCDRNNPVDCSHRLWCGNWYEWVPSTQWRVL